MQWSLFVPQHWMINRKGKAGKKKPEEKWHFLLALSPEIWGLITFTPIMKNHLAMWTGFYSLPYLHCSYLHFSGMFFMNGLTWQRRHYFSSSCVCHPLSQMWLLVTVARFFFVSLQILSLTLSVLFSRFRLNALLDISKGVFGETQWYFLPSLPPSFKVTGRDFSLFLKG